MTNEYEKALEWLESKHRGMTIYEGHPYITICDAIRNQAKVDILVSALEEYKYGLSGRTAAKALAAYRGKE